MRNFVLTSESVTAGHPDKLCDQISDAVIDACLMRDPRSRAVAECAISSGVVFLSLRGMIEAPCDLAALARAVVELIGATTTKTGLKVECAIDTGTYEKGVKISDAEMAHLDITGDQFHPEWNYTIKPRQSAIA